MSRPDKGTVRRLVIRSRPQNNFAVLSRQFLQNDQISAPALAIAVYVLSQPESWVVRPRQLGAHFDFGKDKIYALLNELVALGYVARRRIKDDKGCFNGCEYVVCDDQRLIDEIKAEWRAAGTPALDDDKASAADEDSITYEEEEENTFTGESAGNKGSPPSNPRPENQDMDKPVFPRPDKPEAVNRDEVNNSNREINTPQSPPPAAAALMAQPPSGAEKPPDPPARRPGIRDFVKFCEDNNLKAFRRDRYREKATQLLDKLSDTEAHKAYGCLRNYVHAYKGTFRKWADDGKQGTAPEFKLIDYFDDKAWRKMGIPSDPLELPKPPSADKLLCLRIIAASKNSEDHRHMPYWFDESSPQWQDWDKLFKDNGFEGPPIRPADETDRFCGAADGTRGWRFPTELPNVPPQLKGWSDAADDMRAGFLQLKSFFIKDALYPFTEEEYVWVIWQSFDQALRHKALTIWRAQDREYRNKISAWIKESMRTSLEEAASLRPHHPRPSEYLLGIESGDYSHLETEQEKVSA